MGPTSSRMSRRRLLTLVPVALAIGIGSSLILLAVDELATAVQSVLWKHLPGAFALSPYSAGWIILVLTCIGFLVGLAVWKLPGHAGPDPATVELAGPPPPVRSLPSLLLVTVLALGGGVSLGPENPITATNVALACLLGVKLLPKIPERMLVALGTAGTIGALFGTPVGAALLLSEAPNGGDDTPLWERLFGPLVAAGAGALTTRLFAQPDMVLAIPAYPGFAPIDLVTGSLVALAAGAAGLAAVYLFPLAHKVFRLMRNPVITLTVGGLVLGLLGALGGPLTLFKGLDQMKELTATSAGRTAAGLAGLAAVKLAALIIAVTCGFRGGRIFPSVFIGVAIGLAVAALVPAIPQALCIASAVLGLVIVVTRQGWLSLFLAVTVVPDVALLPVLCLVALPVWILVMGRPEMIVPAPRSRPAT